MSKTRTFEYDGAGNLTKRVDRLGRRIEYVYNDFDQVTSEKWYDGTTLVRTLSFAYTAAGEQVSASDPAATYSYSYDALSRVTSEGQTLSGLTPGLTFGSTLDAAGRRTKLLATLGSTSDFENTYTYDNLSRLTRIQQQDVSGGNTVADKRIDFAYDARSLLEKVSRYADQAASQHIASSHYSRDNLGRLTKLVHSTSTTPPGSGWGSSALAGYQYVYDAASRFTSINSYADGTTTYTHDNTDQLKTADHTGQTDESYAYDVNGNRTMSGYSIGANNRMTSDGTFNYTYDDEGNRLTKTKISNSEKEEYAWDHRNRLTTITFKNGSGTVAKTVNQTYDIYNRWIRRSVDPDGPGSAAAVDTFFSHFDGQIYLEFDGSAASDLTHRYSWGPSVDQLLADEAVTSLSSAGTILWPLTDYLGTPRDLVIYNASTDDASVANHRRYDSYGILISESNSSIDILFGYTGRPFDESTGLNNHWNRWFAFIVWMNEDPIGFAGGDTNLNRYAANQVLLFSDFNGLKKDGHHIVPWHLLEGKVSPDVLKVFDDDDNGARIYNKFYTDHNGSTLNGVSHYKYSQAVKAELDCFLKGKPVSSMTKQQAEDFLKHILTLKNSTIVEFNKGVMAEAEAAYHYGQKAYIKAGGKKGASEAVEVAATKEGVDAGSEAALQIREIGNVKAMKKAAHAAKLSRVGRFFKRVGACLPFAGTGIVLLTTGDVQAAGREAVLEVTGLDLARDAGEGLAAAYDHAVEERNRIAAETQMDQSYRWNHDHVPGAEYDENGRRK